MDASMGAGGSDLKARGIGDIISAAFEIYKANWQPMVIIAAIVAIPAMIVSYFIQDLLLGNAVDQISSGDVVVSQTGEVTINGGSVGTSLATTLLGTFVLQLLLMVVLLLLYGAMTRAAAQGAAGETVSTEASYKKALVYLGPLIIASILVGLGVAGGLILFIVPGLFLAVKWALTIPAVVIEKKGGVAAMGRSWSLTAEHFWHVAGTAVVAYIIILVASAVISAIFGFLGWFGQGLGAGIANAVTIPFAAIVTVLLFVDLRVRKENYTSEQLKADLSAN